MKKSTIVLFAAEVLAATVMRVVHIIRRDKMTLPRGSKVSKIHGVPVYRQVFRKDKAPTGEDELREFEIEGWKPPPRKGIIDDIPGDLPDEK